jgi:hydrogenase maturation protease
MLPVNIPLNTREESWEITEHDGEAAALLSLLDGASEAFLVDACRSGSPCGTVRRIDVAQVAAAPLPRGVFGVSTHDFGLAEAIELGRALGQLPSRCVVYAIEGGSFEAGAPLSAAVAAAVAAVAGRLHAELARK